MPGPAPKPAAQRRRTNAVPGTVTLPATGRCGPPPAWPLDGDAPESWVTLWALPQAVAWERLRMVDVVARYALVRRAAELLNKDALTEARLLEDRLGLSPMAMLRLRWEIAEAPPEQAESAGVSRIDDYRDL